MAKNRLKLNDPFIRNYPNPEKRIEIYDTHTSGLAVRITPTGHKSFVYRYRFNEKVRRFTMGTFPAMNLAEARDEAGDLQYKIKHGTDPLEEKKARKNKPEARSFTYLADQFKQKHLPTLSASTQKTYTERIDGIMLPALGDMKIENIDRNAIINLLQEIAYGRESPIQSNRVRAVLSSMFSFGVKHDIAEYNPVKSTQPLGKEVKRDRVLDEGELQAMWAELAHLPAPTGQFFKVLLLLGQRKGETSRMRWEQLQGKVWAIPKSQTKAGRAHYVPLPPLALNIIDSLKNDCPYVFESEIHPGEPIQSPHETFKRAANRAGISNIRIHDLRRTAATYMAELGTDRTVLGKVLNHKGLAGDSQVTARYDRYSYMEEKRTALTRWAARLQQITTGRETNITKIG